MSTRLTVRHRFSDTNGFHLYFEHFDTEAIYLELDNPKDFTVTDRSIKIRIPNEIFESFGNTEIVKEIIEREDKL